MHGLGISSSRMKDSLSRDDKFDSRLKVVASPNEKVERARRYGERWRSQGSLRSVSLRVSRLLTGLSLVLFVTADPILSLMLGGLASASGSRVVAQSGLVIEYSACFCPAPEIARLKI